MARDAGQRLADILEAAGDLLGIAADLDDDSFQALPHGDRIAFRAMKNALAEIGEAVKMLPGEFTARHLEVDWKGFAGLRDIVAHQYFGLDTKRLLPVIKNEVPGLLAAVQEGLRLLDLDG